jgi:hypothetical protein
MLAVSDRTLSVAGLLVGVVGIVIGVLGSLVIYRLQKRRRQFGYEVISNVPVLLPGAKRLGELLLSYNGDKVEEPNLLVMRFINTGNEEIRKEDFTKPVTIHLNSERRVLSADIINASDNSIESTIGWEGSAAWLEPTLLNEGEWVAFAILTDGVPTSRAITGRIVGVRKLHEFNSPSPDSYPVINLRRMGVPLLVALALALYAYQSGIVAGMGESDKTIANALEAFGLFLVKSLPIFFVALLIILASEWWNRRINRKRERLRVPF